MDDCGTDNSMRIVESWAAEDDRVRLIRNESNKGEGASRNAGMEAARGLYVNTIDPDDWVSCDFYELLYAKAVKTGADIVKGTRIKISETSYKEILPRSTLNSTIRINRIRKKPLQTSLTYEHTTVLFKRELFSEQIRYGKSANACDTTFLLRLCSEANSFALEEGAHYYYMQRQGSSTSEYSLRRSKNELISFKEQIDYIMHRGADIDENAYQYCLKNYRNYTSRICHAEKAEHISSREIEEYITELKKCVSGMAPLLHTYGSVPEIEAVTENDCLLATVFCDDKEVTAEEISDWICYYLRKDIGQGEVIKEKISWLIDSYMKKFSGSGEKEYDLAIRDILKGFKMRDRIELAFKTGYYSSRRRLRRLKRSIKSLLSLGSQSIAGKAAEESPPTLNIKNQK